ncbi:MAG TPA: hypothetical protein VLC48_01575 [Gemmatimonadota bacterium]|nr:hypothetical protein [Gemmatimonadota bacterium]
MACRQLEAVIRQVNAMLIRGAVTGKAGKWWIAIARNAIDQLCPA